MGKQKHFKCEMQSLNKLEAYAREMCAGRCDVTNTERSPQTLPQSQKPSRTFDVTLARSTERTRELFVKTLCGHTRTRPATSQEKPSVLECLFFFCPVCQCRTPLPTHGPCAAPLKCPADQGDRRSRSPQFQRVCGTPKDWEMRARGVLSVLLSRAEAWIRGAVRPTHG